MPEDGGAGVVAIDVDELLGDNLIAVEIRLGGWPGWVIRLAGIGGSIIVFLP